MQFKVTGAHSQTGQDMSVVIDAPTASAAEEQANMMNILVERMDPVAPQAAPTPQTIQVVSDRQVWSPGIAALLSFLIPGAGQLYKNQVLSGLVWFLVVVVGYVCLIVPGIVLHVCCIVGATMGDPYKRAKGL